MTIFLEKYITQLIRFCKVPKFQNERALSMMLSLYMEEIIQRITGDKYKFITVELPIAKDDSNNCINVDYCLLNNNMDTILLVELKTERQGNDEHFWKQAEEYKKLIDINYLRIHLHKSINAKRKKMHQIKYDIQKKLIGEDIYKAKNVKIMYIAPDCIINNELKQSGAGFINEKYKIAFSQLLKLKIDDDFEYIKKYLKILNE